MTRLRIALAVVMAAALLPASGVVLQVGSDPAVLRWHDDEISMLERHMAPLRAAVRGERVIGYWSPPGVVDRAAQLYAIRYTLVPVQVRDDFDAALVVADGVGDPRSLPPELRLRQDFGDGLVLLEPVQR